MKKIVLIGRHHGELFTTLGEILVGIEYSEFVDIREINFEQEALPFVRKVDPNDLYIIVCGVLRLEVTIREIRRRNLPLVIYTYNHKYCRNHLQDFPGRIFRKSSYNEIDHTGVELKTPHDLAMDILAQFVLSPS